jgi:hypothetical protein
MAFHGEILENEDGTFKAQDKFGCGPSEDPSGGRATAMGTEDDEIHAVRIAQLEEGLRRTLRNLQHVALDAEVGRGKSQGHFIQILSRLRAILATEAARQDASAV